MKTTTLFQLGGIAFLIATLLYGLANLMYFLSGQPEAPTVMGLWLSILGGLLSVFGWSALFARQSQRGGLLGLLSYVLLVVAEVYFIGSGAVALGIAEGVFSNEQIAQVPSYAAANSTLPWLWPAGLILLGLTIYRTRVFSKYVGVLLIVFAVVQQLTGSLAVARPIFAVLSFVTWAWLGWSLLADKSLGSREATSRGVETAYPSTP